MRWTAPAPCAKRREGRGRSGICLPPPLCWLIVGDTVTTLDPHTGYSIGGGKYSGQWVTGALVETQQNAADREPRLLMLTYDMGNGNLSALSPSSGGEEAVWTGQGLRPLSLIIAGESLYVVHERGVTRIREDDNLP